jgi:hypothetical protein
MMHDDLPHSGTVPAPHNLRLSRSPAQGRSGEPVQGPFRESAMSP